MINIHHLKEAFCRFGFSLRDSTEAFLRSLEEEQAGRIEALYHYIERYRTEDQVSLYRHMNFLLMTLERETKLPPDLLERIYHALMYSPIELRQVIRKLYQLLWREISEQAHALELSYHNGFHGLEVSMRSLAGAEEVGLFVGDDIVSEFLKCLFLIGAKYHDYIQWPHGHTTEKYHTAEEQTAMSLIPIVVDTLNLKSLPEPLRAPMIQFIEAFFPLIIGPGTTPVFSPHGLFNLSQYYIELRELLCPALIYSGGKSLTYQLLVAIEVLNIADKAALSCRAMIDKEYAARDKMLEVILPSKSTHVMTFLKQRQAEELYYPECDLRYNFYVFGMAKVSQVEMQLELNRQRPESKRLQHYIRKGQYLYQHRPEGLKNHLERLVNDAQLIEDFELVYFGHIDKEIEFFARLSEVCAQTRKRLEAYHCLDELGAPVHQWAKVFVSSLESLGVDSNQESRGHLVGARGNFIGPVFIAPEVPRKEARLLEKLRSYVDKLSELERRTIIAELLFFAMTQPGIHYTNRPVCIAAIEPFSPLAGRSASESITKISGFSRTSYSGFRSFSEGFPLSGQISPHCSLDEGDLEPPRRN